MMRSRFSKARAALSKREHQIESDAAIPGISNFAISDPRNFWPSAEPVQHLPLAPLPLSFDIPSNLRVNPLAQSVTVAASHGYTVPATSVSEGNSDWKRSRSKCAPSNWNAQCVLGYGNGAYLFGTIRPGDRQ
jgi:hypothetical protein